METVLAQNSVARTPCWPFRSHANCCHKPLAARLPKQKRRSTPRHCRALLDQLEEPDQQAKFLPFTAHNEIRQRIVGYRKTFPLGNGKNQTLLVKPVTQDWVEATAELLASSFAEALGFGPYKNYLKRQIRKYVQHHMLLPPKAVVLIALIIEDKALVSTPQSIDTESSSSSSNSSSAEESQALTTSLPTAAILETSQQEEEVTAAPSSLPSGSDTDAAAAALEVPGFDILNEVKKEDLDPHASAFGDGMGIASITSECSSDTCSEITLGDEDGDGLGVLPGSAQLIGVVELSFSESTRSKYMTLNPPVDRPYLCNMAIDTDSRGQGYGTLLLTAAEELVQHVGENLVYLHLRFQDQPAASLYKKAGYEVAEEDSVLVRFLGLDRRYLMRKRLSD